jgi:Protein of unknown function (DUF707)
MSRTSEQQQRRLWVVVPGHGNAHRLQSLHQTLSALQNSAREQQIGFDCFVYVWNEPLVPNTTQVLSPLCHVEYNVGLWTHHMKQVPRVDTLNAATTINATTATTILNPPSHVAILMDDVNAQTVSVPKLLEAMERGHLDVAAPSIADLYPASQSRLYCQVHETGHVDMLFTVFTSAVWQCWQDLLDTTLNAHGWGYDLTLANVCHATVGVVDQQSIRHEQACGTHGENKNCEVRTYSIDEAKREMRVWFAGALNVTDTDAYYNEVINTRPYALPYCQYTLFRWIPATAATTQTLFALSGLYDHAWQSVVDGLNQSGILAPAPLADALHHARNGSVELLESIDARFATWNGNLPIRHHCNNQMHLVGC